MSIRANAMGIGGRVKTTPIPVQRTTRNIGARVLTSMNAGKMVPIMAIPLLREDSISRAQYRIAFEMQETVEILMNAINVRVLTYLVPRLAFDRFDGLDDINRSYEGVLDSGGNAAPPWFKTNTAPADMSAHEIYRALGIHATSGSTINDDYIAAYNHIWNFRAKNRSPSLTLRTESDATLAPSFWDHQTFAHVVPDFDQAIIDGEVPLNVTAGSLPIKGLGLSGTMTPATNMQNLRETGGTRNYPFGFRVTDAGSGAQTSMLAVEVADATAQALPLIYAEMAENGITVSLSNIEMARKTQAFAALRRQYAGLSDDYLVDLLMDGISIPDEAWKHPMLLSDVSTVFGMSKRYASDGASLTESVVNGVTALDVRFSVPRVNMGGIVMMVAEIAPEQLFERQKDVYLTSTTVDVLPQFLRDTLDPEKVEVVTNDTVDCDHATPAGTFGYAPLNHLWAKSIPRVGGRFMRPDVDGAFDEDRQRIWAVETANPVLGRDFYLVSAMNYNPFVVTDANIDHFDCLVRGQCSINGNTVFGGLLVEATDDYEQVLAEAPQDRLDKPASTEAEGAPPEAK